MLLGCGLPLLPGSVGVVRGDEETDEGVNFADDGCCEGGDYARKDVRLP